jgi:enolase
MQSTTDALDFVQASIELAGYNGQIDLGLDIASSEFFDVKSGLYTINSEQYSQEQMVQLYQNLIKQYPIISIEDGFAEDDVIGWSLAKVQLEKTVFQIGDDLFVTNSERFQTLGLDQNLGSGILIKPNQIGTILETCTVINTAKQSGYITAISHRSGETIDTLISDLAVACNSEFIKLGAPARGERVAKYNRLIEILG